MNGKFKHKALNLQEKKPIVFTALSKKYFYMRILITKFVLEQNKIPLNPFTCFDYFLFDTVERDIIRNANNNLVSLADELWVFGSISDGVMAEIKQVKITGKPIRYFKIEKDKEIIEIKNNDFTFEDGMENYLSDLST